MTRAINALLQEKNIHDHVLPSNSNETYEVDVSKEDHKRAFEVEFVAYFTESSDFTSFVVGYKNDFTGLYVIFPDSSRIALRSGYSTSRRQS
jgi:hypothetical protein